MKPKIPNPRSKPLKFGMERLQQGKINTKTTWYNIEHKSQTNVSILYDIKKKYNTCRMLHQYDEKISKYLSKFTHTEANNFHLIEHILNYIKKNKIKQLNLFEDGIGEGYPLAEIKRGLNNYQIKCKTTGINLTDLVFRWNKKYIDKEIIKNVADYLPDEKQDIIISVFGGLNYVMKQIQKEVLLKYIYSLKKNGIGIFVLDSEVLNIDKNPKQMQNLKTALQKRGFSSEIYINHSEKRSEKYNLLIVERTDIFKKEGIRL